MLGLGAVLAYLLIYLIEAPVLPVILGVLLGLNAAALAVIATGRRWAPALGASVAGVVTVLLIAPEWQGFVDTATNPLEPLFLPLVLLVPLGVVAAVAGIAATAQLYRRPPLARRTPRWLAAALIGVGGLTSGYLALTLLPRPVAALSVTPRVLGQLPAVETQEFRFAVPELRVRTGETVALRLLNRDKAPHSFDVDELEVHVPMTSGLTALTLFRADRPGVYAFYCAVPGHANKEAGTGMVGRLIVES